MGTEQEIIGEEWASIRSLNHVLAPSRQLHDVGEINCGIAEALQDQLKEMKSMTTSVNEAYELIRTNQAMASNTLSTSQELDDLAKKMSSLVAFFNVESEQHESLRKVA